VGGKYDLGTIFKTTDGGVSFVEEELIDEIPQSFTFTELSKSFHPLTKLDTQSHKLQMLR